MIRAVAQNRSTLGVIDGDVFGSRCEITVRDVFDELAEENRRLTRELLLQKELTTCLDELRDKSMVLVNNCRCDQNIELFRELLAVEKRCRELERDIQAVDTKSDLEEVVIVKEEDIECEEIVAVSPDTIPTVVDVEDYRCAECGQVFDTSVDLDIHANREHNEEPYRCHDCNIGYRTGQQLSLHLKNRHGLAARDPKDDHTYNTPPVLITEILHQKSTTGPKQFRRILPLNVPNSVTITRLANGQPTPGIGDGVSHPSAADKPFICGNNGCRRRFKSIARLFAHKMAAHSTQGIVINPKPTAEKAGEESARRAVMRGRRKAVPQMAVTLLEPQRSATGSAVKRVYPTLEQPTPELAELQEKHNRSERERRERLSSTFDLLREQLPEKLGEPEGRASRLPRISMLKRAEAYIKHLKQTHSRLEVDLQFERMRNTELTNRWMAVTVVKVKTEPVD